MNAVTPYKIGNQVTNWLLHEGEGTAPWMIDREIYENGAENGSSRCWFFGLVDEDSDGNSVVLKCHADEGDGMDLHDHLEYMSSLMNTGQKKRTALLGAADNKGVGARIAALYHNQGGMDVYARTAEEAAKQEAWHLVRLLPEGLQQWETLDEDGEVNGTSDIVEADADVVAQFVNLDGNPVEHGVFVALRGDGAGDTWEVSKWKDTYLGLQSRYYEFPVPVWVDGQAIPTLAGLARSDYRYSVPSLRDYYAKHCVDNDKQGEVVLSDGTVVKWFVFHQTASGENFDSLRTKGKDAGKPFGVSMETGPSRSTGWKGIALLDHSELFDHNRRFDTFGIIGEKARNRVSLIVAPDPSLRLRPSTNRQHLEAPLGEEIPWVQWGEEFAQDSVMPPAIAKLMDDTYKSTKTLKASDLDLIDPEWWKRVSTNIRTLIDPAGDQWGVPERDVVVRTGATPRRKTPGPGPSPRPGPPRPNPDPGTNQSQDRKLAKAAPRKAAGAKKATTGKFLMQDLEVQWLNEKEWADTVAGDPETDVVRVKGWVWYVRSRHTVYMRRNGDPFAKTYSKFSAKVKKAQHGKVRQDVESAYSMEVLAKIIHIQDGVSLWTQSERDEQLVGLSLSAALCGLNSVESMVVNLQRRGR